MQLKAIGDSYVLTATKGFLGLAAAGHDINSAATAVKAAQGIPKKQAEFERKQKELERLATAERAATTLKKKSMLKNRVAGNKRTSNVPPARLRKTLTGPV